MSNLIPVGELKPQSFFNIDGIRGMKLDSDWYVYRNKLGAYTVSEYSPKWEVQPLPLCDSFDWQLPREPTALELAKRLSLKLEGTGCRGDVDEIIAAMEREAKQ